MHRVILLGLPLMLWIHCGKGDDGGGGSSPVTCTGKTCACNGGETCDVTEVCGEANDCSLTCYGESSCSGSCGQSCIVGCDTDASCSVTVGAGGTVGCDPGSNCQVTCTGSCTLDCGRGAECKLKCASDAAPRKVTLATSCP
ncbi:hypothetical protein LVJ94_02700 [Pendulispora rubella]|uniref:Tryptophan synthase alpha chain n=1 Tax=Pendulispora rubella TaxID=2741070 RepID=A0ABZ2L5F5_9BACT